MKKDNKNRNRYLLTKNQILNGKKRLTKGNVKTINLEFD